MSEPIQSPSDGDVTQLLHQLADGETAALDDLLPLVYSELRRIAHGQRKRGRRTPTLVTTELVHEAYLRFAKKDRQVYKHREHFYAVAALAMKQILLDEAKSRLSQKRGGEVEAETLDPNQVRIDQQAELMVALDRSLEKLGKLKWRVRRVAEYRYFGGLTEEETACAVGVDVRTVRRDWAKARAWLTIDLGFDGRGPAGAGQGAPADPLAEPARLELT